MPVLVGDNTNNGQRIYGVFEHAIKIQNHVIARNEAISTLAHQPSEV